jgi:thioredoxin reductase (NADPH)
MVMQDKIYDLVVVGLGPASYSAGIYAKRYNLDVLLVGDVSGGYVSQTHLIENYPGYKSITGMDLGNKMQEHYLSLNGELELKNIVEINKKDLFELLTDSNEIIKAKTVIIATGTKRKKLNIDGEDKFLGRGVSYCATCDAPFFKNKTVAVVGGGNSALGAVLHLSQFASKIYLIHRRNEFRADSLEVELAKKCEKVEFILDTIVNKINGVMKVQSLDLENVKTNELKTIVVDGVFIEAGSIPVLSLTQKLNLELDPNGYIKVKEDMSTNVNGLYAAGDCANALNGMKQIVAAVATGALASESAYKFLHKN